MITPSTIAVMIGAKKIAITNAMAISKKLPLLTNALKSSQRFFM